MRKKSIIEDFERQIGYNLDCFKKLITWASAQPKNIFVDPFPEFSQTTILAAFKVKELCHLRASANPCKELCVKCSLFPAISSTGDCSIHNVELRIRKTFSEPITPAMVKEHGIYAIDRYKSISKYIKMNFKEPRSRRRRAPAPVPDRAPTHSHSFTNGSSLSHTSSYVMPDSVIEPLSPSTYFARNRNIVLRPGDVAVNLAIDSLPTPEPPSVTINPEPETEDNVW